MFCNAGVSLQDALGVAVHQVEALCGLLDHCPVALFALAQAVCGPLALCNIFDGAFEPPRLAVRVPDSAGVYGEPHLAVVLTASPGFEPADGAAFLQQPDELFAAGRIRVELATDVGDGLDQLLWRGVAEYAGERGVCLQELSLK